tara:strand:+ start:2082 stop:2507 length:426 start_codon:yes stop_codon:yes gene_type:complete
MNKSNVLFILATCFLILVLLLMLNNPLKIIIKDSLNGEWVGKHKNSDVVLEIKKGNACSLKFNSDSSSKKETFNGDCIVNMNKTPYSFIITNILEVNKSLYSLIKVINKDIIHISEFSTKWKLRPVIFTNENTIILKRNIY